MNISTKLDLLSLQIIFSQPFSHRSPDIQFWFHVQFAPIVQFIQICWDDIDENKKNFLLSKKNLKEEMMTYNLNVQHRGRQTHTHFHTMDNKIFLLCLCNMRLRHKNFEKFLDSLKCVSEFDLKWTLWCYFCYWIEITWM